MTTNSTQCNSVGLWFIMQDSADLIHLNPQNVMIFIIRKTLLNYLMQSFVPRQVNRVKQRQFANVPNHSHLQLFHQFLKHTNAIGYEGPLIQWSKCGGRVRGRIGTQHKLIACKLRSLESVFCVVCFSRHNIVNRIRRLQGTRRTHNTPHYLCFCLGLQ